MAELRDTDRLSDFITNAATKTPTEQQRFTHETEP
jgi:hypothetical protein